jgi:hypothetical protein
MKHKLFNIYIMVACIATAVSMAGTLAMSPRGGAKVCEGEYVERLVVVGKCMDEHVLGWLQDYVDGRMGLEMLQSAIEHHQPSGFGPEEKRYLEIVRSREGNLSR